MRWPGSLGRDQSTARGSRQGTSRRGPEALSRPPGTRSMFVVQCSGGRGRMMGWQCQGVLLSGVTIVAPRRGRRLRARLVTGWLYEQIAADTVQFRLPLQRMWFQLLGLAAHGEIHIENLRVNDEGDFLGEQRLLAFRARIKPEIRFRQQSEKIARLRAETRLRLGQ